MVQRDQGKKVIMKNLLAKKTIISMLGIFMSVGVYADNNVYIDQTGNSNSVTITQDYDGNNVGGPTLSSNTPAAPSNTNRAIIDGSNNIINIDQIGAGNKLGFALRNDNTSVGSTLNYQVYGTNNVGLIVVDDGNGGKVTDNSINIIQRGNNSDTRVLVNGDSNVLSFVTGAAGASVNNTGIQSTISGSNNTQTISFTGGNGNTAALTQSGDNNSIGITAAGATNAFTVNQDGTTGGAHTFATNVTGSGNTMGVIQAGSVNTSVNISVNGASNTYSINTNTR